MHSLASTISRAKRASAVTDQFSVAAERAECWDETEARRRLGRAYARILSYGKREAVNPSEAAEIIGPSNVGDTVTSEPQDE
jgi:hypothetical protein